MIQKIFHEYIGDLNNPYKIKYELEKDKKHD